MKKKSKRKPSPAVKAAAERAIARSAGKPLPDDEPAVPIDPPIVPAEACAKDPKLKKILKAEAKKAKSTAERKTRIKFTQAMADRLCEYIISGKSLRSFCAQDDAPCTTTVLKWLKMYPDFAVQYARAREEQAEAHIDELIEISDDMTLKAEDRRVKIDTRKWIACKLKPRKYGEKIANEISGIDGGPIETKDVSDIEIARRLAYLLGQAMLAKQGEALSMVTIDGDAESGA